MRSLYICVLVLWGIAVSGDSYLTAQGFLRAEGKNIVDEEGNHVILRGMGLGGWMLQEGYMLQTAGFANAQHIIEQHISDLIGDGAKEEFYDAWLANHVTREDIDSLKSWGFNSIRLPMHYNLFTLPIEEEPVPGEQTWLDEGFEMTDSLLSWCAANEMYLILDLHAAPGGQGRDEGISDYDTTKPSLWESEANRTKTVELWRRLANHYKDEQWIGGYDLINETNWELDNNQPLRDIYMRLTEAIREVDQNHILFIEGNWFANDFTNLTPQWDDNLVYSPHKYWSINDQASIQWVIDIRDRYDVPIYFGESGENSNVWFRDAIRLLESHNMGWAWWPMKKVEDIAGPLSIVKTDGYQRLLDFWSNGGPSPDREEATAILMQLTELLKIENCIYQNDVIDAMFRQIDSDETLPNAPHVIPGLIYTSDYDLGSQGTAYNDNQVANFHVSTGNFTAWNNGWTSRNDGVDMEKSLDITKSNGFNIGWTQPDEWIKYSADIETGVYDVRVRVATLERGKFHLNIGDVPISRSIDVVSTGGWQTWTTVTVPDVILFDSEDHFRLYIDEAEFNIGSFEFVKTGDPEDFDTQYLSSSTIDDQSIQIVLSKPLDSNSGLNPDDFDLTINGIRISPTDIFIDPDNPRRIIIRINQTITTQDVIRVAYGGSSLSGIDDTSLAMFGEVQVENEVAIIHAIPGKVEAEDFFDQSGIELENTNDEGGGQNIGFLDRGDFLDYFIDVAQTGIYLVEYRTAALSEEGAVSISIIEDEVETTLDLTRFEPTGAWQTWRTTSSQIRLPEGRHHIRVRIESSLFNMNWMQFSIITSSVDIPEPELISITPNPGPGVYELRASDLDSDTYMLDLFSTSGHLILHELLPSTSAFRRSIELSDQPDGTYVLRIQGRSGYTWQEKIIKAAE